MAENIIENVPAHPAAADVVENILNGKKDDVVKSENAKQAVKKSIQSKKKIVKKKAAKQEKTKFDIKIFGKWSSDVSVMDPGLRAYITLEPKLVPRSAGANQRHRFHKSKMHIVERLALHLMGPGHSSKRHQITSGPCAGKFEQALSTIEKAFDIIEKQTQKNPVEIFIRALENAAQCEEVTSYQIGSIIVRSAVVTAPQRRIDKCLRLFVQGSYKKSFNKKTTIVQALADEILGAYSGKESYALKERERVEKEAAGAR